MYEVNGAPPIAISTRREDAFGVTVTAATADLKACATAVRTAAVTARTIAARCIGSPDIFTGAGAPRAPQRGCRVGDPATGTPTRLPRWDPASSARAAADASPRIRTSSARHVTPARLPRWGPRHGRRRFRLEHKSQRHLHHARRARRDDLPESRVRLGARRVEPRGPVNGGELRVVEDVIDLPAKLQPSRAAAERDVLEQRDVRAADAGAPDDVFR